jgi:HK97 family phage major capsid protein
MTERMTDLVDSINSIGENFDKFTAKNDEKLNGLQEWLEVLETKAGRPGKVSATGESAPSNYRAYFTPQGKAYEIPAATKMADLLPPSQKPEISFERWLGAVVAGEKSSDEVAKSYVRETKTLVTTTTGVVIPEQFQSEWIDLIRAQSVLQQAGITTLTMDAKV